VAKIHSQKLKFIFFRSACICLIGTAVFGIAGCAKIEDPSQQVETKPFSVPQNYRMSSSLAARINSIYIYDANDRQYALLTEEIDQVHYNLNSYLAHLEQERGSNDIDAAQTIETDAIIACKKRTSGRLECYVNAKMKSRDISITFQAPEKDNEATREILHSYLNSIGEEDENYVCSDFLMDTEQSTPSESETNSVEEERKAEATEALNEAEPQTSVSTTEKDKTMPSASASDALITVIDKTASHTDEE